MNSLFDKSKKLNNIIKDNTFVLLAFFCSALISLLIALCYELVPFGDRTILRMDLYHQYGPLFAELYERIKGSDSFLYSWCSGGGSSFLGNFFNYLSSPLSLCVLAFRHENITEAISFMIFTKACFASATFSYYLKKSQGKSNFITSAFGVLYAFSGYFIAYYWNLMWLDAMVFLPLIILGIERIIKKGKPTLYILSLSLTMFSNYYMSYMVCIFSVTYFIFYYFSNYSYNDKLYTFTSNLENTDKFLFFKNIRKSRLLNTSSIFALSSLLSGALIAFSLIPTFLILQSCSATSGTFPEELDFYNNIFDFIVNHFANLTPTIRSSGEDVLPNIYCGVLTVVLIPLFYFTKSIQLKEKIAYTVILIFMFLSFNINYLNYIWHGFHFPNDLPYRFSFMYSFLILTMGYKTIRKIKEISPKIILGVGMGVTLFVIIAEKVSSKNLETNAVLVSLAFVLIYTLVLYLLTSNKYSKSTICIFILCAIVSEYAIANTNNYEMNQDKTHYVSDLNSFNSIKKEVDEYNGNDKYRMELTNLRTRMDPCWYNYNGVSTFSSMAYENVASLQRNLGLAGNNINSYTYNLNTPVYNAMFGLKYIFNNSEDVEMNSELYTEIAHNNNFTAYENDYYLPIAFATKDYLDNWDYELDNPFDVQNQFFALASGVGNILNQEYITEVYGTNILPIEPEEYMDYFFFEKEDGEMASDVTVFVNPSRSANYYLYVRSYGIESLEASIGDRIINQYMDDEYYILDLGKCEKDEMFTVTMPIKDDTSAEGVYFYLYYLDENNFKEGYDFLKSGSLNIKEFDDTKISGDINVLEDGYLYTSIPYDMGWNIKVDGKSIEQDDIIAFGNALLGIKIKEGYHNVEFSYSPQGLKAGVIISIAALFIFIASIVIVKKTTLFNNYSLQFDPDNNPELSKKKKTLYNMKNEVAQEQKKIKEENIIVLKNEKDQPENTIDNINTDFDE